jgi:hypothetical protein
MRWSPVLVALTGCTRLFGLTSPELADAPESSGDAIDGAKDGAGSDGRVTPGACTAQWVAGPAITTSVALGVNTTGDEKAPFVTADGLDLYYSEDAEVYRATRASTSVADFTNPGKVGNLSSGGFEGKTFVASNKLRAFFASTRGGTGGGGYDLFRGSRNTTTQNFSVDQQYLGNLNTATDDIDPHLTDDLLHIYYSKLDSAAQVIARSTRATVNDSFGTPAVLTELTSGAGDSGPTLTADELVIVFSSNRLAATGGSNLWYATRSRTNDPFGTPQLVPAVNSSSFDETPHLTPDGCTLYWSSTVSGSYDLYSARIQ